MSDVVYLLVVVAFFALAAGYVRACGALVGAAAEPLVDEDGSDSAEAVAA
jgi:hypothetical protein